MRMSRVFEEDYYIAAWDASNRSDVISYIGYVMVFFIALPTKRLTARCKEEFLAFHSAYVLLVEVFIHSVEVVIL